MFIVLGIHDLESYTPLQTIPMQRLQFFAVSCFSIYTGFFGSCGFQGCSFHSSAFLKKTKNICVFHCRNAFNPASLVPPLLTFWDSLNWQSTPLTHKAKMAKNCLSGDRLQYLQCVALRPFPTKGTFLTFISFSNTFSTLYANLIMRGFHLHFLVFPFFCQFYARMTS